MAEPAAVPEAACVDAPRLDAARLDAEWLEADGQGGFASGTVSGIRTRRYHALLLTATTPPTGRVVLVNGLEVWVETPAGRFALSAQRYAPDVVHPDGQARIAAFEHEPWPRWTFRLEDGNEIIQEVIAAHRRAEVVVRWRRLRSQPPATLLVRPLLSGRDYHSLQRENGGFDFTPLLRNGTVAWRPYPGLPAVVGHSNGQYLHEPQWYRNFLYTAEQERGLDCIEDLASPGILRFALDRDEAVLVLRAEAHDALALPAGPATAHAAELVDAEIARRQRFALPLHRAADQYIVRRGQGRTIVAGYPWFTDWGRDTFIALRGFMVLPGGLELARDILLAWAPSVSEGMLPNRFPDGASEPEYNAVDASLWYVICAHEFLQAAGGGVVAAERAALERAVAEITDGYRNGTRFGIALDQDGLLKAGVAGWQLTWMDAKIGDWVVTGRIGKPVEVQALWLNALKLGADDAAFRRGLEAFRARFWNGERSCLFDVVDADHEPGRDDPAIRPNQILAVGGLPVPLLEGERARSVVDIVERQLLTAMGLRSLGPAEPGYRPHYGGAPRTRDSGYHQGTVWPWLMGPFVDAWVRVRGSTPAAKREAEARFLEPIRAHLETAGLGHVSEVADGEPPHRPGGCPFQAWSLSELLRASALVKTDQSASRPPGRAPEQTRAQAAQSAVARLKQLK